MLPHRLCCIVKLRITASEPATTSGRSVRDHSELVEWMLERGGGACRAEALSLPKYIGGYGRPAVRPFPVSPSVWVFNA
eukprot:gene12705-biopygen3926